MNRETIAAYIGVLLLGALIGDYLALFARTKLVYGGLKYPIILLLSIGLLYLGRNEIRDWIPAEPHFPLLFLLAFFAGSALHHDTIQRFPYPTTWLMVWSGMIPTTLILIQRCTTIPIAKGHEPIEVSVIIGLGVYLVLRVYSESWETPSAALISLWPLLVLIPFSRVIQYEHGREVIAPNGFFNFERCVPIGFLYGILLIGGAGKEAMKWAGVEKDEVVWFGGLYPSTMMVVEYLLWISVAWIIVTLIPDPTSQISEDE